MGYWLNSKATRTIINGHRYAFSSIEFEVADVRIVGIKSLTFSESLTPGRLRGVSPRVVGRTPGTYEASLQFELYTSEWEELRETLGDPDGAVGTKEFNVSISFAEKALPAFSLLGQPASLLANALDGGDTMLPQDQLAFVYLIGCRVNKVEETLREGSEPASVVVSCDVSLIRRGKKGNTLENYDGGEAIPGGSITDEAVPMPLTQESEMDK